MYGNVYILIGIFCSLLNFISTLDFRNTLNVNNAVLYLMPTTLISLL